MQYEFSLPTKSDKVPAGSDWIHEIKYDGYRMVVIRDQDRVRLISRGGRALPAARSRVSKIPLRVRTIKKPAGLTSASSYSA
jgi:bifunctional non-homologous end joining protein LigD